MADGAATPPFSLFGLDERFSIDQEDLKQRYLRKLETVHPDRFVTASAAERRAAETMSANLNEAYSVLSKPLSRAACLLAMRGTDPFDENQGNSMPIDFLERQMELREQLEEIQDSKDQASAAKMASGLDREIDEQFDKVGKMLDSGESELDEAVKSVRMLRYLINCRDLAKETASG